MVSLDERMVYSSDPIDENKTVLKQETIITVSGVPLTSYMENYLENSISKNSFKVSNCISIFLSWQVKINRVYICLVNKLDSIEIWNLNLFYLN